MGKIGLYPGSWLGAIGLVLGGLFEVMGAGEAEQALSYVGWLAIIIGLLVLIWGVTIDGEQWWTSRQSRKGARDASAKWVPLHKALRYLALESAWSRTVEPSTEAALDSLLERELKEQLAREEVRARGVEGMDVSSGALNTETTVPIPPDFWTTAFFQAFGEVVLADDDRGAASRHGKDVNVPKRAYRAVIVDMNDIEKLWPKATGKEAQERSVFHYALKHHYFSGNPHDPALAIKFKRLMLENAE